MFKNDWVTECNSHETQYIYPNLNSVPLHAITLNDQQQFRLNKINEIKDYFIAEIKALIILLSVTTDSISTASFATVLGAPVGIVSACLLLHFPFLQELWNNCWKQQEIKRKSIIKLLC